jgi:HD-GYP domain-containing protein (c-di-GMP phosphodiesterase class II)
MARATTERSLLRQSLHGRDEDHYTNGNNNGPSYTEIELRSMKLSEPTDFPIYIFNGSSENYVLYKKADTPFTDDDREKLMKKEIDYVYVRHEDVERYLAYVESQLHKIIRDPNIPYEKRSEIFYDTAKFRVRKILEAPRSGESIKQSKEIVTNMVDYLLDNEMALTTVLDILSYDYYTYTHSVNVSTFAISLAYAVGIEDTELLHNIGVGALLHDVWKSGISQCILNKPGLLNNTEWKIIKEHPLLGEEILRDKPQISRASREIVLQHHEKCNGQGYPYGLRDPQIADTAKIAAVCDVFDALTTRRCYKDALETFPALNIMKSEMPGHFDEGVFHHMVFMLGGLNKSKALAEV